MTEEINPAEAIKMCGEMPIPLEYQQDMIQHALDVNPDNYVPPKQADIEGALDVRKLWPNGSTLKVCFLGGDPAIHKRIEPIAHEWSQYANLKFQFIKDADAEIRISFDPKTGSWSYMGVESTGFWLRGKPSMNYGWLKPNTSEQEYRRVVLHEFGHAIGLYHEHLSPNVNIPWNEKKVIDYYAKTNGWTEAYTRSNVLAKIVPSQYIRATRFDPKSIMLYAVDKALTTNGFSTEWNSELSEADKKFVRENYPF